MSWTAFGKGMAEGIQQQFGSPENVARMQRSFEQGLGTYNPVDDPEYWQHLEMVQTMPSDANISGFIDKYGEYLDGDDYASLLRPSEGTLARAEEDLTFDEIDFRQQEIEREVDVLPHRYDAKESEYISLGKQHDLAGIMAELRTGDAEEIHSLDMREKTAGAGIAESQLERHNFELSLDREYAPGERELRLSLLGDEAERSSYMTERYPEVLDLEIETAAEQLNSMQLSNIAQELQNQLKRETNPLEIEMLENELDFINRTLDARVRQQQAQADLSETQVQAANLDHLFNISTFDDRVDRVGYDTESSRINALRNALDHRLQEDTFNARKQQVIDNAALTGLELEKAQAEWDAMQEFGLENFYNFGTDETSTEHDPGEIDASRIIGNTGDGRNVYAGINGGKIVYDREEGRYRALTNNEFSGSNFSDELGDITINPARILLDNHVYRNELTDSQIDYIFETGDREMSLSDAQSYANNILPDADLADIILSPTHDSILGQLDENAPSYEELRNERQPQPDMDLQTGTQFQVGDNQFGFDYDTEHQPTGQNNAQQTTGTQETTSEEQEYVKQVADAYLEQYQQSGDPNSISSALRGATGLSIVASSLEGLQNNPQGRQDFINKHGIEPAQIAEYLRQQQYNSR